MKCKLSVMAQEPLLCTVCLGVSDVTTVCNSAPLAASRSLPPADRGAAVTLMNQPGDVMRSLCIFPSFPPGLPCCSHTSSHLCAQLESHLSAQANSLLEPFFFFLHHLFFSHTMFVPTFQSLPWQLVSAY